MSNTQNRYEQIKQDLGGQRLSVQELMCDKYKELSIDDRLSLVVKDGAKMELIKVAISHYKSNLIRN